ncbi:hypothetical protein TNCV_332031 [Trichonephila clavipes]|nr:hypothetical protein TNCV_332031 [Trichonephila clavipes]
MKSWCMRLVPSVEDLIAQISVAVGRIRDKPGYLLVRKTDHQIGTFVHAPQRPMVTCIMMGTVVPGPHGLLCF